MRGVEIRRPLGGERGEVLARAAGALERLGYQVTAREDAKLRTKHAGKVFTSDPSVMRHFLDVVAEGEELRFHFHTGLLASAWTDADRKWAESRVDELLGGSA